MSQFFYAKKEDNFQELISELDWRFYKVQWTHIRKVIEPINLFLSKLSATEITTPTEQMNELETVFRNSLIDFEVDEFVNLYVKLTFKNIIKIH